MKHVAAIVAAYLSFSFIASGQVVHKVLTNLERLQSQGLDPRISNIRPEKPAVVPLSTQPERDVPTGTVPKSYRLKTQKVSVAPNIRMHPNFTGTQSEMSIHTHPTNPDIVIAGSNAADNGVNVLSQGWYYTTNGGATWLGRDTLPTHTILSTYLSDPGVGIDLDNRLYFSALNLGAPSTDEFVSRSTNDGTTWTQAFVANPGTNEDKGHFTVDVNPGSPYENYLYSAFTDFGLTPSPIVLARSTDHGQSFSPTIPISGGIGSVFAQGINLAVGPGSELYAVWSGYDAFPTTSTKVGFNVSTDGGATWGVAHAIDTIHEIRGSLTKGGHSIRVSSFPSMAVDRSNGPRRGWIYVVYPERVTSTPDIMMIRSTNGGASWSSAIKVNQDGGVNDQWYPWATVDPTTGGLYIVYYDSRNFPANDSAQVYISNSLDGGNTFEDVLVSDMPFLPAPIPGLADGYMGDYIGIAALDGIVWPCWNDNRTGRHQAYTSRIQFLSVGSNATINVSPDTLDFGTFFIGLSDTMKLNVRNLGYPDTLFITDIRTDSASFRPIETSLTIPGGNGRSMSVIFSPADTGLFTGNLLLTSNDSIHPVLAVPMRGNVVFPPVVGASPDSIALSVYEGDSSFATMTLRNTGLGEMQFTIKHSFVLAPPSQFPQAVLPATSPGVRTSDPYASLPGKDPGTQTPGDVREIDRSLVIEPDAGKLFATRDNLVLEINPVSGAVIRSFNLPVTSSNGQSALAYSGSEIFFTDANTSLTIYVLEPDSGHVLRSFSAVSSTIDGLAYVGGYLYALDYAQSKIYELNPITGTLHRTLSPAVALGGGLDGGNGRLFASNFSTAVYELSLVDGSVINSFVPVSSVYGLGFTGQHIYTSFPGVGIDQYDPNTGSYLGRISTSGYAALAGGGSDWLSAFPIAGTVAPHDSVHVQVRVRTDELDGGTFRAKLTVHSNDPVTPALSVPLRLTVIGAPNLVLDRNTVNFVDAYVDYPDTLKLIVSNNGSDTLHVTGMSNTNARFTILGPSVFNLAPSRSQSVLLRFLPLIFGRQTGLLSITSNDPSNPTVTAVLTGNALLPPIIETEPDSVVQALFTGDSAHQVFTVYNTGFSNLNFKISFAAPPSPGALPGNSVNPLLSGNRPDLSRFAKDITAAELAATGSVRGAPGVVGKAIMSAASTDILVLTTTTITGSVFRVLDSLGKAYDVVYTSDFTGIDFSPYRTIIVAMDGGVIEVPSVQALAAAKASGKTLIMIGGTSYPPYYQGLQTYLLSHTGVQGWTTSVTPHLIVTDASNRLALGLPATYSFVNSGASAYMLRINDPSAPVAAKNGDNNPILVNKSSGEGILVYFTNSPYSSSWSDPTDFAIFRTIVSNALDFNAWIDATPRSGIVPSGGSIDVDIRFNAEGLYGGDYRANVQVASNDPATPKDVTLAHLHVTGAPNVVVSRNSISYGDAYVGLPKNDSLKISNTGTNPLSVSGISSGNPRFVPDITSFNINPGGSRMIHIALSATDSGAVTGSLTIRSNDPTDSVLLVALSGHGIYPPVIVVAPDSLGFSVLEGDSASANLNIANTGLGTLHYNVRISESLPAMAHQKPLSSTAGRASVFTSDKQAGTNAPQGINLNSSPASGNGAGSKSITQAQHIYTGTQMKIGISDFGELMPFESPFGFEHLQVGGYVSGYTLAYFTGGFDNVAWSTFQEQNRFTQVSYNEIENSTFRTVVEVVVRTDDNNLEIKRRIVFDKSGTSVGIKATIRNISATPVTNVVLKEDADWDVDGDYNDDNWDYDATHNMIYAYDIHYVSIAGVKNPDFATSSGWGSFRTRQTTDDRNPHTMFDGLEVLHYEMGDLAAGEERDLQVAYSEGSTLADLQRSAELGLAQVGGWISVAPDTGSVAPGGNNIVQVKIKTDELDGGTFHATIHFENNDPGPAPFTVPVELRVIGQPEILLGADTINFGNVYIGYPDTLALRIENKGSDTLHVSNIVSSETLFTVLDKAPFAINPHGEQLVRLRFSPSAPTPVSGTLTVASNDPRNPAAVVQLLGAGIFPPVIAIIPDSLGVIMNEGDSLHTHLKIANNGGGTLYWGSRVTSTRARSTHAFTLPAQSISASATGVEHGYSSHNVRALMSLTANLVDLTGKKIGFTDFSNYFAIAADLVSRGATVVQVNLPLAATTLDTLDVLSIDDAITSASPSDISLMRNWLQSGKALVMQGDDNSSMTNINALLSGSGVYETSLGSYSDGIFTNIVVHPTTEGVDSINASSYGAYSTVVPPAQTIVFDNLSRPNIVVSNLGAGRILVSGNEVMESSNMSLFDTRLFSNQAIDWLANSVDFVWISPVSGIVAPADSQNVDVTLKSDRLDGGTFHAYIQIDNNDPAHNPFTIPVALKVVGKPDIALSKDSLIFGDVFINNPDTLTFVVTNKGSDTLHVSSMIPGNPRFTVVGPSAFTLPQHASHIVSVRFYPTVAGPESGPLTIRSDDPQDSLLSVKLLGNGVYPPVAGVSPDSLAFSVTLGDSATATLTLSNTGLGPLNFSVQNEGASSAGANQPSSAGTGQAAIFTGKGSIDRNNSIQSSTAVVSILMKNSFAAIHSGSGPVAPNRTSAPQPGRMSLESVMQAREKFGTTGTPVKAVVLDSYGTDYAGSTWDWLNANWGSYGSSEIIVDYASLNKEGITYADLVNSHADVLLISDAWSASSGWQYTDAEWAAIRQYLGEGHGLIATSGSLNSADAPNNKRNLTPLFGLDTLSEYYWPGSFSTINFVTPGHELLRNITPPYQPGDQNTAYPTASRSWSHVANLAKLIATSPDSLAGLLTYKNRVYISNIPEENPNQQDFQLLYNAIVWTAGSTSWLSEKPTAGTVPPGQSTAIEVKVKPDQPVSGTYKANILISSNDPVHPQLTVPVTLTLFVPSPILRVSPESLMTNIVLGDSAGFSLTVFNDGDGPLHLSASDHPTGGSLVGTNDFSNLYHGIMRGNIYRVYNTSTLEEFKNYCRIPAPTLMQFAVYESNKFEGPYHRLVSVIQSLPASNAGFQSSGLINVQLRKGKYYFLGAASRDDAYHYRSSPSIPIPFSWGAVECGGLWTYDEGHLDITPTRGSAIWSQSVVISGTYVRAIVPDNVTIPVGSSRKLVVSTGNNVPFGNFAGEVVLESNDNTKPVVSVPLMLNVALVLNASTGWNTFSVPVNAEDNSKGTLFPNSASAAFNFTGHYGQVESLKFGEGYWLKYESDQVVSFRGKGMGENFVPVRHAWNLIGPPSYLVTWANIQSVPFGNLLSHFVNWSSAWGYYETDSLLPGTGSWVRATGDGELIFNEVIVPASGVVPPMAQIAPSRKSSSDDAYNTISFTDVAKRVRTLYFSSSVTNGKTGWLELPPPAPAGEFDVRYASQRLVEEKDPEHQEFPIEIAGASFPMKVQWTIHGDEAGHSLAVSYADGRSEVLAMKSSGSVLIADKNLLGMKLVIGGESAANLPKSFAMYQNYPNPFNPSTRFRFDLPADSRVRLYIYNTLGQEVARLIDGVDYAAGTQSVVWNGAGRDAQALPSGVYFYRIDATPYGGQFEPFTKTGKMLLMK